jgi:peptidoglycan/LPS O-acetylase OafA/YrhL
MFARFAAGTALAIAIAWISRRTIEEYFLRKKPGHRDLVSAKEVA